MLLGSPSALGKSSTSASTARSRGSLAMTPRESYVRLMRKTPSVGAAPRVSVMPYMPLTLAGSTLEPPVSVPMASGAKPAAMLTADPDDEPPDI